MADAFFFAILSQTQKQSMTGGRMSAGLVCRQKQSKYKICESKSFDFRAKPNVSGSLAP
jgi:hypothetical protein